MYRVYFSLSSLFFNTYVCQVWCIAYNIVFSDQQHGCGVRAEGSEYGIKQYSVHVNYASLLLHATLIYIYIYSRCTQWSYYRYQVYSEYGPSVNTPYTYTLLVQDFTYSYSRTCTYVYFRILVPTTLSITHKYIRL